MAWLWILGSAASLVILLLISSVHVSFHYEKKAAFKVRWLFFSVDSEKEKKQKETEKKPAEKKEKEKKKQKPSFLESLYKGEGLSGIIDILSQAAETAKGAMSYIFNKLIVKSFVVDISVSAEDAASTAIRYGQVCAAVYPCAGVIVSNTRCRSYRVDIYPDFDSGAKTLVKADFKGKIKVVFLLKALLTYGLELFRVYKDRVIPAVIRGEKSAGKSGTSSQGKPVSASDSQQAN